MTSSQSKMRASRDADEETMVSWGARWRCAMGMIEGDWLRVGVSKGIER
jgi:hypothetical protein